MRISDLLIIVIDKTMPFKVVLIIIPVNSYGLIKSKILKI